LTETAEVITHIISITGRFRRAANFYDRIAADTGGTVYYISKSEIATVLDEVIEV
jgi:hypothetical protein